MADKRRDNFEREWSKLFEKQFQLSGPKQNGFDQQQNPDRRWVIASVTERDESSKRSQPVLGPTFEQTEAIEWLKMELNRTKSLLNDYDIKVWREHTSFTNLCSYLSRTVKKTLKAELCTNAWLKFATILNTFDIISSCCQEDNVFGSMHLCEAPGAFVTCLNHHLINKYPDINWQWIATTLNPYYEGNDVGSMINDDRFIKETLPNWDFGVDYSGNIMDANNLKALKERSGMLSKINLVTADGGIDCSDDPCMQEVFVAPLLYWEIATALEILSPGGSFVIKIFTAFEKFTISLIYILCCAFEEVHFCKPGPSKPGNSEVYVICKDYHGKEKLGAAFMTNVMKCTVTKNYNEPIIPMSSIPTDFFEEIIRCEEFFVFHQVGAINYNIKTFHNISKGKKFYLHLTKEFICEKFISTLGLKSIESKDHISYSETKLKSGVVHHYTKEHNFHVGNFYERQTKKVRWNERIKYEGDNSTPSSTWYHSREEKELTQQEISEWKPVVGKKFDQLRSTQFCCNYLMMDLFEARKSAFDVEGSPKKAVLQGAEEKKEKSRDQEREIFELESFLGEVHHDVIAVVEKISNSNVLKAGIFKNTTLCSAKREFLKSCENSENCNKFPLDVTEQPSRPTNEDKQLIQSFDFREKIAIISLDKITGLIENGLDEKVNVLISSAEKIEENIDQESARNIFLLCLILCLRILKKGGTLVCKICDIFGNFNGGIVYVLSRIFEKITFFKPSFSYPNATRYIICCGFSGKNEALLNYLLEACKIETDQDDTIMHLLPIQKMLESNFLNFLRDINSQHARLEMNLISQMEK